MTDPGNVTDLVALDEALQALAKFDERKSRGDRAAFFWGLSVEETATILNVSVDTVMRDWKLAKARLLREMRAGGHQSPSFTYTIPSLALIVSTKTRNVADHSGQRCKADGCTVS